MNCEQMNCEHYNPMMDHNCDSYDRFNRCGAKNYKGNRVITQDKMNEIIENLEDDIIAFAITYRDNCNRMVRELKDAIQIHKECLLKEIGNLE